MENREFAADRDEEFKAGQVEFYDDWLSFGPFTEDKCANLITETRRLLQEELCSSLFCPSALLSPQR